MPRPRQPDVVIHAEPRADGLLSVVEVRPGLAVFSNGVEVLVRYTKLLTLCEQVAQEQAAVAIRTWETPDGEELMELHRVHGASKSETAMTLTTSEEAF
jgi:hypothetical protein